MPGRPETSHQHHEELIYRHGSHSYRVTDNANGVASSDPGEAH